MKPRTGHEPPLTLELFLALAVLAFRPMSAQPRTIGVTSVSPSSVTIIAGQQAQLSATLEIPPHLSSTSIGILRVLLPPGATNNPVMPGNGYPVNATGPTEVRVRAADLPVTTRFSFTVAHESNLSSGRQVAVIVRPPHPVSINGPASLTSGTTATFYVLLDAATRTGSTLAAHLSSSNAGAAPAPPTATMSGDRAQFSLTLPPGTSSSNATLSATVDGVMVSRTFPVLLPVPQSVTATSNTVSGGGTFRVTATFNGAVSPEHFPRFVIGDTALQLDENSRTRTATSLSQNVLVRTGQSAARPVTVSMDYGGAIRSATVNLLVSSLSTGTATPSSGRPGESLQATALMSSTPGSAYTLSVTSADTTLATIDPFAVKVTGLSKAVVIRLRGSPTIPRQVPITATLKSDGVTVSTKALTITVNPPE